LGCDLKLENPSKYTHVGYSRPTCSICEVSEFLK